MFVESFLSKSFLQLHARLEMIFCFNYHSFLGTDLATSYYLDYGSSNLEFCKFNQFLIISLIYGISISYFYFMLFRLFWLPGIQLNCRTCSIRLFRHFEYLGGFKAEDICCQIEQLSRQLGQFYFTFLFLQMWFLHCYWV